VEGEINRNTRKAKVTYPKGFICKAELKSPTKILPTDLVVPQNGQGKPVKLRKIQSEGPVLNPDVRRANALTK